MHIGCPRGILSSQHSHRQTILVRMDVDLSDPVEAQEDVVIDLTATDEDCAAILLESRENCRRVTFQNHCVRLLARHQYKVTEQGVRALEQYRKVDDLHELSTSEETADKLQQLIDEQGLGSLCMWKDFVRLHISFAVTSQKEADHKTLDAFQLHRSGLPRLVEQFFHLVSACMQHFCRF